MEERGAEERKPTHRAGPDRIAMQRPELPARVEIEDAAADHGDGRSRGDPCDLRSSRSRQRDVVRVEPGDVAPGASSRPRFSDAASPSCSSLRSTTSRGSPTPAEQTPGVSSVDASSTTISSRSSTVCRSTLSTAAARIARVVMDGEENRDERHGR